MRRVATIVLAAGSGTRFGHAKQFLELTPGVRLVDAALDLASRVSDCLVLVVPEGHTWDGRKVDAAVTGGNTRRESVVAGLSAVPTGVDVIVVHDAAHPLTPLVMFHDVIEAVTSGADAAVPFQPMTDVVKRSGPDGVLTTVGRDGLGLAQVPMAFLADALRAAHSASDKANAPYWEDSMLIEAGGGRIVATLGSTRNIHIVTEEDLRVAQALAGLADV